MKTIPVSLIVAGILAPVVSFAQPEGRPQGPPAKGEEGGYGRRPFMEAWKAADTNEDGFISKEEFEAIPRIEGLPEEKRANLFARLDKNGDGKLDRGELGRIGKPREGRRHPMSRLWELDTDNSGGVSFEEFKAGQIFKKLPPEKQEAVFRRLDSDGDGVITPKDKPEPPFRRGDGKGRPMRPGGPPMEPHRIIRHLDLNGDGAVSFEEFKKGPAVRDLTEDEQEERFEALDRNKDLKITAEDFPPPPPPPHGELMPPPAPAE